MVKLSFWGSLTLIMDSFKVKKQDFFSPQNSHFLYSFKWILLLNCLVPLFCLCTFVLRDWTQYTQTDKNQQLFSFLFNCFWQMLLVKFRIRLANIGGDFSFQGRATEFCMFAIQGSVPKSWCQAEEPLLDHWYNLG